VHEGQLCEFRSSGFVAERVMGIGNSPGHGPLRTIDWRDIVIPRV
jgi:hypothetical protein